MSKKFLMLASVLATGLVLAQGAPPAGGGAPAGGGGAPPGGGSKLDHAPLFAAVDTNKDGKITKAEWQAAGLSDFVFDMADAKKAGSITLADLNATTPPDAIDANKDGKVSLEEMKTFLASMGSGGGASGGAPPGGGAPPSGGSPPASK
ncbi:MAG: hypothetical protein QM718_12905 [Steroidobacteraceae bacterium]